MSTVGNTNIETAEISTSTTANSTRANKYRLNERGTITSLSFYTGDPIPLGGCQFRLLIYGDDGSGNPGPLLGRTDDYTVQNAQAWGWVTLDLQTPVTLNPQDIWLAIQHDGQSGVGYGQRHDNVAGQRLVWADTWSDGPLDPQSGTITLTAGRFSFYATYTPVAATGRGVAGAVGAGADAALTQERGYGAASGAGYGWKSVVLGPYKVKFGGASAGLVGSGPSNRVWTKAGRGVAGGLVGSGAKVYVPSSNHLFGSAALKVDCLANGDGVWDTGATLPCTPGKKYRATVWVKAAAGESVDVTVVRPSGASCGAGTVSVAGSGTFQRADVVFTMNAGATEPLRVKLTSTTGAQTFYVDGVQLREVPTWTLYSSSYRNGAHSLSVKATDLAGNVTESAAVAVTLANPVSAFPQLIVEVAFDSNPRDETQTWTDVTADFVEGDWSHGRSDSLDRFEAGQLSALLRNYSRQYDNVNPDSPYYGKVVKGKRIRVRAVVNGTSYPRWEGSILDWTPVWTPGGKGAYVQISAEDDFAPLNLGKFSSPQATMTTNMRGI